MKARFRHELRLVYGADNGDIKDVQIALKKDVNLEVRDDQGWTALQLACYRGHYDIAKLLIDSGADMESRTGHAATQHTSLMTALNYGRHDVFQLLLENGADVEAKAATGHTALLYIADQPNIDKLRIFLLTLLKFKPSFDATDKNGKTALELAKEIGNEGFLAITESYFQDLSLEKVIKDASDTSQEFHF